jgi:hypothetical protein
MKGQVPTVIVGSEAMVQEDNARFLLTAVENFLNSDVDRHRVGLKQLLEAKFHLDSTLVIDVLVSSLETPDLEIRAQIAAALAELLLTSQVKKRSVNRLKRYLRKRINRFCEHDVITLLEIIVSLPEQMNSVCHLFDAYSEAGRVLFTILEDRKEDLRFRQAAAKVIGQVGYLDIAESLEIFCNRLEGARAGQLRMPFATTPDPAAEALLPVIHEACAALRDAGE